MSYFSFICFVDCVTRSCFCDFSMLLIIISLSFEVQFLFCPQEPFIFVYFHFDCIFGCVH